MVRVTGLKKTARECYTLYGGSKGFGCCALSWTDVPKGVWGVHPAPRFFPGLVSVSLRDSVMSTEKAGMSNTPTECLASNFFADPVFLRLSV